MENDGTHGERVRSQIIATGLELWRADPASVSARGIGKRLNMTHSAVLYHFGSTDGLRGAVAAQAVRDGDKIIVPMLIAAKHPAADSLTMADRRRYLAGC